MAVWLQEKLFTEILVKAGFYLKTVLTSLDMTFLPMSCSRFKEREIPLFKTIANVLRFCINFWAFWERYFFLNA